MTNEVGNEVPEKSGRDSSKTLAIVAIIAVAVIIVACILSCAATAVIFIYNAPW